jgi:hypothetical protein
VRRWTLSHRADPRANALAKRHYTCQTPQSAQFMPPGSCFVLGLEVEGRYEYGAVFGISNPIAAYVKHAWAGAWVNTIFRCEVAALQSELIREAVALTRGHYGEPPPLGLVTFIDPEKVRPPKYGTKSQRARNFGTGYRRAGFRKAICPDHMIEVEACAACAGRTKAGLIALQLLPDAMPEPARLKDAQVSLFDEEAA